MDNNSIKKDTWIMRLSFKSWLILLALFLLVGMLIVAILKWEDGIYLFVSQKNTITDYQTFLEQFPDSDYKEEAIQKIEALSFQEAKKRNTVEAYQQFIDQFPGTEYTPAINRGIEDLKYAIVKNMNTLDAYQEFLDQFPSTVYRQDIENAMTQLDLSKKIVIHDRSLYEKYLTSPSPYKSIYQQHPLYHFSQKKLVVSPISYTELISIVNEDYVKYKNRYHHSNPELERFYRFALQYDLISRLRFYRGVDLLPGQKTILELVDFLLASRWYKEFLTRITENPSYEYMENLTLRIYMSIHTAAHFFQLPIPLFLCLIFQESKFDFKIASKTGAVGLGQLTSVAMKQIQRLREDEDYENRLQAAAAHLGGVYTDEYILRLLRDMGYYPDFIKIDHFPQNVSYSLPRLLSRKIIRETGNELVKRNYAFGKDLRLVRTMCNKIRRGHILPPKYAGIHAAYKKVVERMYGRKVGHVLNPESNILLSAMILRYYMNYRWKAGNRTLQLMPNVRALAAVIAYNEGQKGVLSYFRLLKRDYPRLNINSASLKTLEKSFTLKRIRENHPGEPHKVKEIYHHARAIRRCACK